VFALFSVSSAGVGKSTYALSHPWAYKSFMETYFPTAENMVQKNNTQSCVEWVKLCIDDGYMTACNGPQGNFQMHAVGAYKREAGSKTMEQLEFEFTKAFGDLDKYDPYFEYHMAFMTQNLNHYVTAFKDTPHFLSTFTDPTSGKEYASLLVHIPGSLADKANSLIAVELIGAASGELASMAGVHRYELPRASPQGLARATAYLDAAPRKLSADGKPVLAPVHLSFASSDLNRDVAWFENVLFGTKVHEGTSAEGKVYYGFVVSDDVVEIRYMQPSAATRGPTSVAQWEKYQTDLHAQCFDMESNEGFDRLADNHFGHALRGQNLNPYINAQKAAGLPYRFYAGQFMYLYGPNGWGVQLIGNCPRCPQSGGYDMCTQGIHGHCRRDGTDMIV